MPKFEIRKFKSQRGHEGPGYYCELWMDGKHIAECFDEGNGGPVLVQYDSPEVRQAVYAHIKTLPPHHWEADQWSEAHDSPMDEELFMMELVEAFEIDKMFKRKCKTKTLFRLKGDKPDEYHIYAKPFTAVLADGMRKHYGDTLLEIINERFLAERK